MVTFKVSGSYSKTKKFLKNASKMDIRAVLDKYGKKGVEALRKATPKDTGKTSESWSYEIQNGPNGPVLYWKNSNRVDGVLIALIIQYGHGTRQGAYIQGKDYINPAIRPIFNDFAKNAWKEVTKR